jgi:hypothetical protein
MTLQWKSRGIVFILVAVMVLMAGGCGQADKQNGSENKPKQQEKKEGDHSGWWCKEHGIPEHLCSICDDKVADECKSNGDWCKQHNRARSQCFKCEPGLKEKFAAMYRARYNGKDPPPIEE